MAPPVKSEERLPLGRWILLGTVALAVGAGGALAWQRWSGGSVSVNLPARPALAGRSEVLVKLVQDAEANAVASPRDAERLAALGRIYHANGFFREARACWETLRARQPQEAKWVYYLADLSRTTADPIGLRAGLEETLKRAPDYSPAWLELGELRFKSGQLTEAGQAYGERLRLTPGDPYASLGLARVALAQDRRDEGKKRVRELVERVPQFPSSHNVLAEILAQEGDRIGAANQRWFGMIAGRFRAAADPWMEEMRPVCCDVDQLLIWGAIDLQTKTGDRGQGAFERAILVEPKNPQGYENLGLYFMESGDIPGAIATLEKGSTLPHASELVFSYLGDAYLAAQQPDKALAVAERGTVVMPTSARCRNLRGQAYAAMNRPDDAMAAYREAMTLSPSMVDPVANLGLALLRAGRRDEAIAKLREALALQPGYTKALSALANLALDAGDLPGAAQLIFPFFQQFPGGNTARALMARYYLFTALAAAQRHEAAAVEKACADGLALVPESPELNGYLGIHFLQAGRVEDGQRWLEKSYQLQPADPRVALALAEVYLQKKQFLDAKRVLEATGAEAKRRNDAAVAARVSELMWRAAGP